MSFIGASKLPLRLKTIVPLLSNAASLSFFLSFLLYFAHLRLCTSASCRHVHISHKLCSRACRCQSVGCMTKSSSFDPRRNINTRRATCLRVFHTIFSSEKTERKYRPVSINVSCYCSFFKHIPNVLSGSHWKLKWCETKQGSCAPKVSLALFSRGHLDVVYFSRRFTSGKLVHVCLHVALKCVSHDPLAIRIQTRSPHMQMKHASPRLAMKME